MNKFTISSQHIEKSENGLLNVDLNGQTLRISGSVPDEFDTVQISIDERDILIAKNLRGLLSIGNRLPAMIVSMQRENNTTRIKSISNDHFLETLLDTEISEELNLQVGDEVELLINPRHIHIMLVEFEHKQHEKFCLTAKL